MAVLWGVQVRIRDASHVDAAWALLIACCAILYALLAGGDAGQRVLAAALASLWGFRLGGYLLFNRVFGSNHTQLDQEWRQYMRTLKTDLERLEDASSSKSRT